MHRLLALLLVSGLAAAGPLYAANPLPAIGREVVRDARDAKSILTQPLRWDRRRWARFAGGTALVAALYAVDRETIERVQANRSSFTDDAAKLITPFGGGRATQLSVLLILAGAASGHHNVRDAGRDALESEIIASDIVTPALKRAFGRARPFQELGTDSFHPGNRRYESFPSGHATTAFAFATAVASHYDGWLVPTLVYTMATSVAAARVNDNVHFVSDVVAGALIGRAVAKGVVARHRGTKVSWQAVPIVEGGTYGVLVRLELK